MRQKLINMLMLLLVLHISAQNVDVSGTVLDNTGFPIPGVNVIVKNTTKGTVTDFDGNFTISDVETGAILNFSYVGYITKEVTVAGSQKLEIQLEEDIATLDEVVVVGYGTQKKKEVTGAVSVVDSEAIEKLNPQRVEQALQGQIAGVNVSSNSGSPGAGANIRIRGITTNGDNKPLILVDGNVIEDLSVLNPNDIKSINVLKDATAGIYGVRGANGVILITTKTGRKESELKFTLDAFTGFQATSKKIDLLSPYDFAIFVNDAFDETRYFVYPQEGTDWQDEVFQTAAISDLNFGASGGGKKSSYSFGVAYLNQDGIVGGGKSNFERVTARLSYNYDILDNLKLTTTGLYTNSTKNNLPEGGIGTPLYNAVNINPDLPIYDENGNFSLAESVSSIEVVNPLAQIANNHNISRTDRYSGTIGLDYTFFEKFTVSSKLQINYSNVLDDVFRPVVDFGNGGSKSGSRTENEVQDFSALYTDYTWDSFITYSDTLGDDHNVTLLLGTSSFRTRGHFYGETGFNLANGSNWEGDALVDGWVGDRVDGRVVPRFDENALKNGAQFFDTRLQSIFSRLQYNYKGKYLLSVVVRRDGSSNFGPNNKFGYFPSGSIGWNISDEDFWGEGKVVNSLKLRGSYGIIGNDRIDAFRFITRLDGEATVVPGNESGLGDLIFGTASGVPGNPNLKWEEQESTNIGFDARLFNNKVSLSADAFRKQTKDLLFAPQASGLINPSLSPTSFPLVNAGTVENKGLEFSISYNDNFSDDFQFNIGFNLTLLDNEVISVNGEIPPVGGEFGVGISQTGIARMVPGLPLGHFFGYKTRGIYQTQAEIDALNATAPSGTYHSDNGGAQVGDLIFVDINGDGEITPDDRTVIGDPIAELAMGFNIGFSYKNLDFSANAFASVGNDMIRDYERKDPTANIGDYVLERWQGTGTSNSVPRVTAGGSINQNLLSDFYVEDASFLRLQNAQIGYTVNPEVMQSIGIDKLRIYVAGNNLFTITDYKGFDPSAGSDTPIGNGIDKGFYPVAKSYLLGINVKF
ncbi:TonB-dependent receptor [Hyunsoonleella sp. SJ7]|uniref:TonB-dependent receptor n=1 Tax=Hyunsoonleella aquatilis TaxID=2762758 RepID=A0A923HAA1_9FLAO|nr:TonB-dependent receptor [Hyunsoonleella aquatilis]MBC3757409.1 TonB-dependent receptor [Hyunsoonleella aquatilis]